ncbi:MAG: hypothetical protein ABIH84_00490 [bacterium]
MHDTTAREVADERLLEAQKGIQSLQWYLDKMDQEIDSHKEHHKGTGFPIAWGEEIMKRALCIYNEIARCNGAVLVRAIEPSEKSDGNMIVCERNFGKCNICGVLFSNEASTCEDGHELGKRYTSPY